MDTKHTPTPWHSISHSWAHTSIIADASTIALLDIEDEATEDNQEELEALKVANAEFIVRACNAHDQLVAAVKLAKEFEQHAGGTHLPARAWFELHAALDAALATAGAA